jgi:mono/diheme cytochrome c family protein
MWRSRIVRAIVWTFAVVIAAAGVAVAYATRAYQKTWDVALPSIQASTDPAVIARGRYIVYGPGRCSDCHAADAARPQLLKGEEVPLTGGAGESTYIGSWTAPNLTPDPATGIGAMSDGQLARLLRTGVNRHGQLAPPFMDSYADLAEDDLVAIVSFLRSLPASPGIAPASNINILGKLTLAYFLEPYGPAAAPPSHLEPEPTAAYGSYIATTLAGCRTCHTARNLKTGAYESPFFSGGLAFRSREQPGFMYVAPNLTPDPATGRIAAWSEDAFVHRFRQGLTIPDSPMPWGSFTRLTDTDLRAIYRFLHSLPPVNRDNGPTVQPLKGQVAG